MKKILLIITALITMKSYSQTSNSELILGKWKTNNSVDRDEIEFTKEGTFILNYFFTNSIIDTARIEGNYLLKKDNLLLMKMKKDTAFDEYTLDKLTDKKLIIKIKDKKVEYSKFKDSDK